MRSENQIAIPNNKGIQELHDKSLEWLSQTEFWKTELSFFNHLLRKKKLVSESEYCDRIVENLQKGWFSLESDLTEVVSSIKNYENYLSDLDKSKLEDVDDSWEDDHWKCKALVRNFSYEFSSYKKVLFEFAEKCW